MDRTANGWINGFIGMALFACALLDLLARGLTP